VFLWHLCRQILSSSPCFRASSVLDSGYLAITDVIRSVVIAINSEVGVIVLFTRLISAEKCHCSAWSTAIIPLHAGRMLDAVTSVRLLSQGTRQSPLPPDTAVRYPELVLPGLCSLTSRKLVQMFGRREHGILVGLLDYSNQYCAVFFSSEINAALY
jgi:hypothetical protein